MNSPYEYVIGIMSHGGVPLPDKPDITGSLHEIQLGLSDGSEESHLADCGIHQGAEKEALRELPISVLKARSLGVTHIHADHGAEIPDFIRQREEARIDDLLPIIASWESLQLYPPLAFQSAFIHDQERKRKSQVISETHQELLSILSSWKTAFHGPRNFNRHKRHRSDHKKADFVRHETLRHAVLQENNREMGEGLFLARINSLFGNKESRFYDPEMQGIINALTGEFQDDNRRARNAAFVLLGKKLHDYFTAQREKLPPLLSQYVKRSLELFVSPGSAHSQYIPKTYVINENLQVDMYPTAHVLGSQSLLYKIRLASGRVVKILMSGDIGRYDNNPLGHPIWPSEEIDVAYMEGTYGTKNHPDRMPEVARLVEFLNARIAAKADILIPVFQVQKLQDICLLLYNLRKQGLLVGNVQFFLSGSIVEILNQVYSEHPAYQEVFASNMFTNLDIKTKQSITNGKKGSNARINIAVGGSLQNESSSGKMVYYYNGPEDAVILTGYQFPETIGHDLASGVPHPLVDVSHIFHLESMSGHAGHDDLVRVALEVNSKKFVLVHGEPARLRGLQEALSTQFVDKKFFVAERNKLEPID